MWNIPSIPVVAFDIDVHRPEKSARPSNDPNRRSGSRSPKRRTPRDDEDEFEVDTFEPHSLNEAGKQRAATPAATIKWSTPPACRGEIP